MTKTLVTFDKAPVDGKRPGDTFSRMGVDYRVVRVAGDMYWTESEHGREKWFTVAPLDVPPLVPTIGKFDNTRDDMLHLMSVQGWANESDGDVESPQGYFSRISNSPEEITEIRQAFVDEAPEDFAWEQLIGRFLMVEDSNGFVYVTEYATDSALERDYEALRSAYLSNIDF